MNQMFELLLFVYVAMSWGPFEWLRDGLGVAAFWANWIRGPAQKKEHLKKKGVGQTGQQIFDVYHLWDPLLF